MKLYLRLCLLCLTFFSTPSMGMEENSQQHKTERLVVNHIFEVKHPSNGKPCYLMGTQHVNGDINDKVVSFVTNNISKIYFEKCYEYSQRTVLTPFFAHLYLSTMENSRNATTSASSETAIDFFKESIEEIYSHFDMMDYMTPQEYIDYSNEYMLEEQKKQNEERKAINSVHDADAVRACINADQELSDLQASRNEAFSNLNDHDKSLVALMSSMFPSDNNISSEISPEVATYFAIEQEKKEASEMSPEMETYCAIKLEQKEGNDRINYFGSLLCEEDKALVSAWESQFANKGSQEETNIDWEGEAQQKRAIFLETMLPHIDPIDLITLTLFNKSNEYLGKLYTSVLGEGAGIEANLQTKINQLNSEILFSELETDYTRLLGMRNCVAHHMNQMNLTDPYTPWIEALHLMNSENLETEANRHILPQFLNDVLDGTLMAERENHWYPTIRLSMENEASDEHDLFAVGDEHIANLLKRLESEGYIINRLDF